jgi:hypothetical protein
MIVSIYLEEHEYLIDKPQTLNFGGKYLYSFTPEGEKDLIVRRKPNEKYIPDFFNISESECKIDLLSAIVGQNGVGKSSVLDVVRKAFVGYINPMPDSLSTILVEDKGETKVLSSRFNVFLVTDEEGTTNRKELKRIKRQDYQSIYYSPHFDLKYNKNFGEVEKYNISLDQFIKKDLEDANKKGTNEAGLKFYLHEELLFKNSMRQIEFLESSIFKKDNSVFREVFDLPQYETGILYFRDVEIPLSDEDIPIFHNTPRALISIIELIFRKVKKEKEDWPKIKNQVDIDKHFLKRFVIKAFMSVVIRQMEKRNTWWDEGEIEYDKNRLESYPAIKVLLYFIRESYIEKGNSKEPIFNYDEILPFFEKLDLLFEKETDPDNIDKKNIRLNLDELKDILQLHRKILNNLLHYYPIHEGLVDEEDYIDGFISFRPTERNMSSGENALLNFFSKLYDFIQNNLTEERKSLPDKKNYILLLDEADLGFHPVWKKKYIDTILKTIPYFFESLTIKPKLQIIITTHDPLTLSDLPISNVIFLQKYGKYCSVIPDTDENKIQKTFGANITDLLAHSFFVEDGLIGDFSKSKIREVIDWINKSKNLTDKQKSTPKFAKKLKYYKKVINLIDGKVVKIKLTEMITDLVPDDDYYNQAIDKEIELLKSKKK